MSKHTWNHRVMFHKGDDGDDYFAIHEVHYEDDRPVAYTSEGVDVGGSSLDELRVTLGRMVRCLDEPILTPENFRRTDTEQDHAPIPS